MSQHGSLLGVALLFGCPAAEPEPTEPFGTTPDPDDPVVPTPPGTQPTTSSTFVPSCTPTAAVVINEVQSTNFDAAFDVDGDTPDWIELYNADTVPVALGGWFLTDDMADQSRWILPEHTLQPGEFLLVFASGKDRGGYVATWDTRIDQGHTWRYLPVTGPTEPGWEQPGYDDSAWATGPSGFGRLDGDDATEVSAAVEAVDIRTSFEVTADELTELTELLLHVDYDDGFVAWLNGVEVARDNLGTAGVVPAWDAFATSEHEALGYQGAQPEVFDLMDVSDLLVVGTNTLALTAHDVSDTSSDLSLIPFLTLGFATQRSGSPSTALDLVGGELHTNFSLRADGERVWLIDPVHCVVDASDPGQTWMNQSFGRTTDGAPTSGYFMVSTPGASNTTESRPGFADKPVFSPVSGFYPGGVDVTLTAAPTSTLHMTTDGAEPTEAHPQYVGPVQLDGSVEATAYRARAFEAGLWPSPIATATYFGRDPGPIAVVSLVTDPANLWDEETGIYVEGPYADPAPPHYGANYWQDWERPLHVAFWEPTGVAGFAIDGGVAIHGGWSRAQAQKSLRLIARSGYGDASIVHDLFPGLGITEFDRLVLRNSGNDWLGCDGDGCSRGTMLRDAFMHELTAGVDVDRMAYRPTETYINGEYWGVLNLRERPDAGYVAAHHGYDDIDLIETWGDVAEGDDEAYEAMLEYLRTHDLADPAVYATVGTLIDLEELTDYFIFEVWFDNGDWPGNNIRFWRPRTPEGPWRWLLYDTDFGLGLYYNDVGFDSLAFALEPNGPSWPNPPWSTELFRLLMTSPWFQADFANRYADLLNTHLTAAETQATLAEMAAVVAPVMPRHLARWGTWTDGVTMSQLSAGSWDQEIDRVDDWIAERSPWATEHVVDNLGLAGTWSLQLDAVPPGAGTFQLTAVEVEAPFTGTYFLGVPVTVTAVPAPGYTFVGWMGPWPADPSITVDPPGPLQLTALFQ